MTPAPTPAEPIPPLPPPPATEAPSQASDDERLADLADDFFLRYRRGDHPSVEEYAQQDPSLADRVRDLFPGLLAMEQSQPPPGAKVDPAAELLGTAIGRYKLLERLGEGGFGVVYMAEQLSPVRRKVALKVIKPGLDTQQVIDRFEAERQALALMDHENIARVLDAGATDAGRPYFVMELVDGVPITDYCGKNRLAPRQRLELFVRVCRAIQHAHTKGIIHRDLKPTNVLVAVHDGRPVPKVIDFGVAKATGLQQLADGTLFTNVAQIVGTPLYMSPEQAEMSGLDVNTRSDVYSLGVLLYELLTGTTPLDRDRLKRAGFDEVRRMIREEEPPRPSTRISTLSGQVPAASAQRRSDLKKLGQLVRGELDWIVMKCLEKDRARRYETVSGLAADVERYLNGEAVQACPPSATYRAAKLLRRHKGPVVAASLLVLALVGGIIGTTRGMVRARAEAHQKEIALLAARTSERESREQHYLALLSLARAQRGSGRPGQRFETLRTIAKAAQIRVTPELRQEAAAALTLPDIELAQEWTDVDPTGELTFSFEGDTIRYARVSQQGEVTLCRVTGGREEVVTRLPAYGHSSLRGPWWSDDRRFLAYGHSGASAEEGAGLRVWKLDGPVPSVLLDEPDGVNLSAFAFQSSGKLCAAAHVAGDVSVYDLATGKRRHRFAVGKVVTLAFHPSDNRLAIACGTVVRIFDCNTGTELKTLRPGPLSEDIRSVAWHPDGRRIAMGCLESKICVCDADSGAEVMPSWAGRDKFLTVAFNHAGDRLLSSEASGEWRLWDVASGRPLLTPPHELNPNTTFSADDGLLGFSRDGGKIQVWRVASGRELRVLGGTGAGRKDEFEGKVTDDSGRILAVIGGQKRLSFVDTGSGEELATVSTPADAAMPFAFDSAGGWFTGGTGGILRWPLRPEPGRPESVRIGPPQLVLSADGIPPGGGSRFQPRFTASAGGLRQGPRPPSAGRAGVLADAPPQSIAAGLGTIFWFVSGASHDGKVVVVADKTVAILIHRDRAGPPVILGPQPGMGGAAVSPDGKWIATYTAWSDGVSKSVRIWDGDGNHVKDLDITGLAWCRFSPDGRWFATGSVNRPQLWKVGQWDNPVRTLSGDFMFSPDGKLMAMTEVVGCIRLVKTESGEEVARLIGPEQGEYTALCFTPDGTRLIAGLGWMYVWDLRLIRKQLEPMGLDWDSQPFPPAVPDTRGRLRVTIDTGTPAQETSRAASSRPKEPTPEPAGSK